MTKKLLFLSFAVLTLTSVVYAQDESAREVFKRTRKSAPESPQPKKAPSNTMKITTPPPTNLHTASPPPKKQPILNSTGKNSVAKKQGKDIHSLKVEQAKAPDNSTPIKMGLGYTLFLDDGSGILSSVNSQRVFNTGQSVRLLLESNIDGYVYVFHQENNGAIKMLLPNWQDGRGENYIYAHQPILIPSENKITFTGKPANETLTIVVSRSPISELPMGDKLMSSGLVVVPPALFQRLSQPCVCREDKDETPRLQSKDDRDVRDVTLTKSDPLPSYILLNQDQTASRLTVRVKFTHR